MTEEKGNGRQEEIQVTFEPIKADVPTIYVNNAVFSQTQWDMRIDLSELYTLDVENKKMSIVPRARLIMDFRFAARFVDAMSQNLQRLHEIMEQQQREANKASQPNPATND